MGAGGGAIGYLFSLAVLILALDFRATMSLMEWLQIFSSHHSISIHTCFLQTYSGNLRMGTWCHLLHETEYWKFSSSYSISTCNFMQMLKTSMPYSTAVNWGYYREQGMCKNNIGNTGSQESWQLMIFNKLWVLIKSHSKQKRRNDIDYMAVFKNFFLLYADGLVLK